MALFKISALFTILTVIQSVCSSAIPLQNVILPHESCDSTPLPLIIWHGLGDSFASENLKSVAQLAEATHPGTYTHIIQVEDDANSDRSMSFLGDVNSQVEKVCATLAAHPIISTAPAVDALGFSQGGQFLRAYIERCNMPPVRSLVTFGSQHNGITQYAACKPDDFLCRVALGLVRLNTWTKFVQSHLVPAQYFRDPSKPAEYEKYLEWSNFLADINNERVIKNETYKTNLARLRRFVMYIFEEDKTVVPKESGWFSEVNGTSVTPLRERALYKENWLGLKTLDERGALKFESTPGPHMSLDDKTMRETFENYFGSECRSFDNEAS